MDVQVGERLGRLVLGLYGNVVPKTVSRQDFAWAFAYSRFLKQLCIFCYALCCVLRDMRHKHGHVRAPSFPLYAWPRADTPLGPDGANTTTPL